MPMDLIDVQRRLLKVQNVVGEDTQQVKVLNEIAFPVQIRKIWDTMAEVRDVEINVIKDKVIVEGIVHKQIFYVSDENKIVDGIKYQKGEVFELSVDEPFIAHVDIPGTRPGFHVQVATRIEFIGYDEINPVHPKPKPYSEGEAMHHPHPKPEPVHNLWRQTLILEVFVKVTETAQMEVVVDVVAPEMDLEVIKELLKVQSVVGVGWLGCGAGWVGWITGFSGAGFWGFTSALLKFLCQLSNKPHGVELFACKSAPVTVARTCPPAVNVGIPLTS